MDDTLLQRKIYLAGLLQYTMGMCVETLHGIFSLSLWFCVSVKKKLYIYMHIYIHLKVMESLGGVGS